MNDTDQILRDLAPRLPGLLVRDAHDLRRRLDRARRAAGDDEVRALVAAVEEAEERVARRLVGVPPITYPESLPITEHAAELAQVVRDHQVVIVAGETGSGKSTQLAKICLEAGRGVRGVIGHTQPRRLAARTVAERVAEELGSDVGDVVGYTVRFTDRIGDRTLVRVMTDGILLAEIQRDRLLRRYDTLIIDEAHERSLNIDFILGYLKQLLPRRPDLKLVVTSATIDTERFSRHFDGAPVVEVSGRTYPVEVRYRPFGEDPDDERDQTQAICDAVTELEREGPGDVLVFLSGEREIRDTADALGRLDLHDTDVLPLYARLSAADQHKVFAPHSGRRVVLATNVAETSLTVPGVRYVVDPGTARISRYSRRTKVQRLPIEPVSQASADQRAGRCGRVAPGICIRLYTEDDFEARPAFTEPEVLRTNLASVILQMTAIGLGDVAAFPFVEPPDARSISDGVALLEELGALDPDRPADRRRLTAVGRDLSRLPVDPRIGRMILEADRNGCVAEVMVIAAALSIQDPRERPTGKEQAAAEAHARFRRDGSDFLSFLALWEHLRRSQEARGSSQFRKMCRAEYLNHLRVREWQDVHGQLRIVVRSLGIRSGTGGATPDAIHRSLLAGLLSHIGMRDGDKQEFLGARQARFAIAPGSALFKKPPRWVMAAELVETNRLWGRVAAGIQPEWAEQVGEHLTKASYGDPTWDAKRGTAMVNERVTLYGLPVVAARRVPLGRVDPGLARDLFIHHALVEGDWETHHPFLEANRKLVEEIRNLEDRVRRRDILVGEETLFDLYDERLGAEVTSARHFDTWWKKARRQDPDLLSFTLDDLIDPEAGQVSAEAFPEQWLQDDLGLPLHYEFEPTAELDGVTVDIPLPLLDSIDPVGFDWQVPGLRAELVTAWIRSLPKAVRRHVSPAAEHARAFLERVDPSDGPLLEALAREIHRVTGEPVPAGSWQPDRVPDHLRITFRVVSRRGQPLAWSKDLVALRDHLKRKMRPAITSAAEAVERSGLTSWSIGSIERSLEVESNGYRTTVYPALVDEGGTVAVRTVATAGEQAEAMWSGTRRLLLLDLGSPVVAAQRKLRNETRLAFAAAPYATVAEILEDCATCALDQLLSTHGGPAWDEAGYRSLAHSVRRHLVDATAEVAGAAGRILTAAAEVERRLDQLTSPALQPALTDIHTQVARLVHAGFVAATGASRLADVERYIRAIEHRLDKLVRDPHRDGARMRSVQAIEERVEDLRLRRPGRVTEELRWTVEELRVSLFAESLGTARPVSEKRVMREIERLSSR